MNYSFVLLKYASMDTHPHSEMHKLRKSKEISSKVDAPWSS